MPYHAGYLAVFTPQPSGKNITPDPYQVFDRKQTADLLPFKPFVDVLRQAVADYTAGRILSPECMVVPLNNKGVMFSMPAVAPDLAIHKLVNVVPDNRQLGLSTLYGQVAVFDAQNDVPLFVLDGPEVTGRRTAAVSMLGIIALLPEPPREILLIGSGTQFRYHLLAIAALYPECRVWVRGTSAARAQAFCDELRPLHGDLHPCVSDAIPDKVSVVITLTTSQRPVYNAAARAGLLIIGVGVFKPEMAEIGEVTLSGSDIYLDDPDGARHEAGDLIQANIDWRATFSLAQGLTTPPESTRPIVFKTVGTAAWDLAAGRVQNSAWVSNASLGR
ncbi:bifunctional Delta(1)-pyrroline-2-carboxylate/Delta(1)-piperideine-2-carboxylate reductase [Candidatus Sodalis pierantonius]|uniref:bifunctional Delta(1)-pyrroline-2-carboxylate/Delta(1)-piperideine-2- carboxylate reductase n=1 Tax=Candidatus Sodalis pierantonii TaxID=1486991 RepID=UPI0004BC4F2F|nr:bifunctional Delta(1)-pyrroline-2-carboxylate/Delta(1)-piperideine-2-carboxylate reductase [Candidatus Sodalis pierantonius]